MQWELAAAALQAAVAARAEVEEATEQLAGLQSEAAEAREVAHWTAAELQVCPACRPESLTEFLLRPYSFL